DHGGAWGGRGGGSPARRQAAHGGRRLAAGPPHQGRPTLRVTHATPLPRLHAITDERIARRADLDEIARQLAAGGGEQLAFQARGAAYLLVGPVFPTATRPSPARAPLGPGLVTGIVGLGLPVIAIGGVTPERLPELRAAGVYGVAAIRALWDAADPRATARRMVQELNQ